MPAPLAGSLFPLLIARMAWRAEGLQRLHPKQVVIASVRNGMVGNRGRYDQPASLAHAAERLFIELSLGLGSPSCGPIPVSPWLAVSVLVTPLTLLRRCSNARRTMNRRAGGHSVFS